MRDCKLVLAIGSDFPGKKLVPGLVPPKRLEELLTLHELPAHARLRRSLASTNGLESSFFGGGN